MKPLIPLNKNANIDGVNPGKVAKPGVSIKPGKVAEIGQMIPKEETSSDSDSEGIGK